MIKATLAQSLIFALALIAGPIAVAQELDGKAIRELALQGTWDAEEQGYGYWSWNEDGSVCLRTSAPTGECEDIGTWESEGDLICYELEWWGEVYGQRDACISVVAHEGKPYEVILDDAMNSTMFHFTLLE